MMRRVAATFEEYGFKATLKSDGYNLETQLILERNGESRMFQLEFKLPLTSSTVTPHGTPNLLYVTDHVSARTSEALRRMGVQYVDWAGNTHLHSDGWYVDVRGKRPEAITAVYARTESPINLYSAKRAQVIFVLLTWRELLDESVRTIAEVAGVSVGLAQSTTNELRERALWPDRSENRSHLIDGWVAAFPETLARSLTLRSLRAERLDQFYGAVLASGEAAQSAQMRATSGVVYVDSLTNELLMMNRWRTDGSPNLIVRRRFWSYTEPDNREAPALMIYADLHASDDPRTRSVAAEYRSRL